LQFLLVKVTLNYFVTRIFILICDWIGILNSCYLEQLSSPKWKIRLTEYWLLLRLIIYLYASSDLTCVNQFTPMQTHGESKQCRTDEKLAGMKCSIVARQNTMYSWPASYKVRGRREKTKKFWGAFGRCWGWGAELTCGGRLFQTSAPETGNARLPIEERVLGTMTRSDDAERKPGRPAWDSRTKPCRYDAGRQAIYWPKDQDRHLEADAFSNPQPMQRNECVGDVLRPPEVEGQPIAAAFCAAWRRWMLETGSPNKTELQ
jgi:hypothetical protein